MKPKRALGYARVSSVAQALGTSLEDQQASIRRHAESVGVAIARMYVETESGIHEKIERREQINALMRDVREGDLVLVDKLDRWSRDTEWSLKSVRQIREAGAAFFAVSDNCDPSTREGDMMLTMRAMMAKEEHARIRARTVGTRNLMRRSGLYTDPLAPRGYTLDGPTPRVLTIDVAAAEVVRQIFVMSAGGSSYGEIASALGLSLNMVYRALKNRHYLGEVRDGKGGWQRGKHEAIISADLWARARAGIEERQHGGPRPRRAESRTSTWLLRNVAYCGACGARMAAAWSRASNDYYRCAHKCGAAYVRVDQTEEAAPPMIVARLGELRLALAGSSPVRSPAPPVDAAKQRAKLVARRTRVLDLYEMGDLSREALRERTAKIDADLGRIDRETTPSPLESPKVRRQALRVVGTIEAAWAKASREVRREIVEGLVVKAFISRDEPLRFEWRSAEDLAERG